MRTTPLLTGAGAGDADRAAVAAGETWDGLMARAGHGLALAVVDELRGRTGGVAGRDVVLVAGKGDNGGDAWVAARVLRDHGVACTVVAVHGVEVATSDHSGRARAAWLDRGGRVVDGIDALPEGRCDTADVVVDAVLGTGIRGAPREVAAEAIAAMRQAVVVAADVPSGVDGDTGAAAGEAVRAVRTATFGARKRGLVLHPGAVLAGRVDVVDLGPRWRWTDAGEPEDGWAWQALLDGDVELRALAPGADKRARGRVVVVAGSRRYAGAAALTAAAAVRAGAGLVTLLTPGPAEPARALEPAVMVVPLPAADDAVGGPGDGADEVLAEYLVDADVAVVGPGLGHGRGTRAVVEAALATPVGVVLDADGINVFRGDADALADREGDLVLTPQHRELARLVDPQLDGSEALSRRHELVPELAERLPGVVVVGKGPGTVVASVEQRGDRVLRRVAVATSGGPALGSGGTGDVLAGLLGGLDPVALGTTGPGSPVLPTVAAGVHLHGLLGERAGARAGGRATASDLLDELPAALADLVDASGRRRARAPAAVRSWRRGERR